MSEKELVKRCVSRDRKAQRALYDLHVVKMTRLCLRYTSNESLAFELMTTSFTKIFEKIKSFEWRGEGSLDAWMSKIVINECLAYYRKFKRKNLVIYTEEMAGEVVQEYDKYDADHIYEAIRRLPEGYRQVFNLYEIEGYSHKEISKMVGITESTSRSQLMYARRKLRTLLE